MTDQRTGAKKGAVTIRKWTGICLVAVLSVGGCTSPRAGTVRTGSVADVADTAAVLDDGLTADSSPSDAEPDSVAETSPDDIAADAFADVAADAQGDSGADVAVPACCGETAPCPSGWTCGGGAKNLGSCKPLPAGGQCWSAADCPKGVLCAGAFVCPCNVDCGAPGDTLGQCQGGPVGCCTTNFDCQKGERCVGQGTNNAGVCKPVPAWGGCWDGNDCAPTQKCAGGQVCPCNADCDAADQIGQCTGSANECCTGAGVCPAGAQCMALSGIGWSTCVPVAEPGRCWKDVDCLAGQKCQGAAFCPCNGDCGTGYFGPGVCTPLPPACTAIQPAWVAEICNAKGLVVWNGSQCVSTCPGCCGCEPFCDKTFESQAACQEACL